MAVRGRPADLCWRASPKGLPGASPVGTALGGARADTPWDALRYGAPGTRQRLRYPGDWLSGRAPRSHRGGHWFDPSIAHQQKLGYMRSPPRRVSDASFVGDESLVEKNAFVRKD